MDVMKVLVLRMMDLCVEEDEFLMIFKTATLRLVDLLLPHHHWESCGQVKKLSVLFLIV